MRKKTLFIIIGIIIVVSVISIIIWKNNNITSEITLVKKGTLVQEVSTTGKVEFPTKVDLRFKNSGKLVAINTGIGKRVSVGQLLAKQDTTQIDAQILEMKSGIILQEAKLNQLRGGISNEEIELSKISLENAKNSYENTVAQQNIAVANAFSLMLNSGIEAVPTISGASTDGLPTISGTYNGTEEGNYIINIYATGNGAYFSVSGLESGSGQVSTIAVPLGSRGLYIEFPSNSILSYSNTTWKVSIPNTQSSTYLTYYNAYKTAVQSQSQILATAQALVNQREAELSLKEAPARPLDIAVYQAQINQAEALLQKIQSQKNELMIFAPSSGLITKTNGEVGEIISPDKSVISFVPENVLQIKLNIIEDKIVNVKVGQEAEITFDAIPNQMFNGKIISIDSVENEIQGSVYYESIIVLDKVDKSIKSGMTANVLIKTATSEDVLFVPISVIQKKDNKEYVEVLENKKIIKKEVDTGLKNSTGMVEIISGLLEGEQVIISTKSKK